jgi:hypothetical protein
LVAPVVSLVKTPVPASYEYEAPVYELLAVHVPEFVGTDDPELADATGEATLPLTMPNVPLALSPTAWIPAMQTTTIRDSMTAYSTAVGPSSRDKNFRIIEIN